MLGSPLILNVIWLDTQLGRMIAIASDLALYLLEFVERRGLDREIERLKKNTNSVIIPGRTAPINSIEKELAAYFDGQLTEFRTPLCLLGSPFQKQVWTALKQIPFGTTRAYLDIAKLIDNPSACRAVARANSANQLAIIIPCHRVINSNGNLGGYAGGLMRKQSLLDLEKAYAQ